jgi:hypothetical protein
MRELRELETQFLAGPLLVIVRQIPRSRNGLAVEPSPLCGDSGAPARPARAVSRLSLRFHEKVVDPCSN